MHKKVLFFLFVFAVVSLDLSAQCSMCRFAAESSYAGGSDIGKGLNNGIVYIMGLPYIILATLGFVFFRKQVKEFLSSLFSRANLN